MPYKHLDSSNLEEIVDTLATRDHKLASVINMIGPCRLEPGVQGFPSLVYSIIGQQLSSNSARAIRTRLDILFENDELSPEIILKTKTEDLRGVGMSWGKALCLHSLAKLVLAGEIDFSNLEVLEDEEIVGVLTQVKGIGRWTAEMFLMFSLGRLDVFPIDDQSIRSSLKRLYNLTDENFRSQGEAIADKWRPYRTIASWYLYRYLDLNIK